MEVFPSVRMSGAEKATRARNREGHRVLIAISDPVGDAGSLGQSKKASVGGDIEGVVGWVDAETVNMDRAGIRG